MRILVTYYSETGNTKKVAEAICNSIEQKYDLISIQDVSSVEKYGLIFLGFPVHQCDTPHIVKEFSRNMHDKKIALFFTHAMSKEAPLFEKQTHNCISSIKSNEVVGVFSCIGELNEITATHMCNSKNELMRSFEKMRHHTLHHPDYHDISNAQEYAKKIIESVSHI